jgi:hypothetical protein
LEGDAQGRDGSRLGEELCKPFDGPSNPSTAVPIGNEVYTLGYVCQAHNCGGNELYVLFAPGGAQAWGLLITGEDRKWLGNPDAAIQAAILSGAQ